MLNHAHRRNATKFTLLAGDQDFRPLVESLVQDGIYVTVWYSPLSFSRELVWAADAQRQLTFGVLVNMAPSDLKTKHACPEPVSIVGEEGLPKGELVATGRSGKWPAMRVIRKPTGQVVGVMQGGTSDGVPMYTCTTHTGLDQLTHYLLAERGARYQFQAAT